MTGTAPANPLSLAAGVLPEFGPEVVAEAAGQAGFPMAGFTIEPEGWSHQRTRQTAGRVAAFGLEVLDVEVIWIPEGGKLDDGHRLIIDVGAELGARNVLVVSAEPDIGRTAAALRQLCEWAAPAGMRVALEFLMICQIRNLADALAVVAACDHPAAAILIDTLHLARAGNHPRELATVDPRLLPYAQFCDGNADCEASFEAYLEDAVDLRSAAGEGQLPLTQALEQLPADCPLSLEVRSRHYRERYPDPTDRARAVLAGTRRFLADYADHR